MSKIQFPAIAAIGLMLVGSLGCRVNIPLSGEPEPAAAPAVATRGSVEDLATFDRFIAGRPTPAAFRERYPSIRLVLPGEIATRELRLDRSRYFADLDEQQRIRGGRFQ